MDNKFDFDTLPAGSAVHFTGIGGISMSGLAEILLKRGFLVSGSDIRPSHITKRLESMNAEIYIGQKPGNIKNPDLVVYTAAIRDDNPEYAEAIRRKIPTIDRATLLGSIMKSYQYAVAVAGTHGKTTTTSMLSHIFLKAGLDPTISIGGELPVIGGNIRVGKSDYFICEACEYHQSFLRFFPFVSIILNVEEDHLDYFRNLDHVIETFKGLTLITPPEGAVIINADDKNTLSAIENVNRRFISCSVTGNADYTAKNVEINEDGTAAFDAYEEGKFLIRINLAVPGSHNISNALAAIAASRFLDISPQAIAEGLCSFSGVGRRFEHKGTKNGIMVVDDYAHHPTEIKATLNVAKSVVNGSVWCVFQPHTYTRTSTLFSDFVEALDCGIKPLILDIYAAREKDTGLVSSKQLAGAVDSSIYIPSFDECVEYLKDNAKPGDMILTMGAGDVYKVGEQFLLNSENS